MPSYCCVPNCKTSFIKGTNIQFFRFPLRDDELTKQWVKAINRIGFAPTKGTRICSKHFTDNDYLLRPIANVKRLKGDAVPSIFNFTNDTLNSSSLLYRQFTREWKLARVEQKHCKEIDDHVSCPATTDKSDKIIFIKTQPENDEDSIEHCTNSNYGENRMKTVTHTEVQTSKSLLRPIVRPLKQQIKLLKRTIERRDRTIRNLRQRLELLTSVKEETLSDDGDDNCSEISSFEDDDNQLTNGLKTDFN